METFSCQRHWPGPGCSLSSFPSFFFPISEPKQGTSHAEQGALAQELHKLLREERLAGATLLILANKQDIAGALPPPEIEKVGTSTNQLSV
jgi:hypothetical protein